MLNSDATFKRTLFRDSAGFHKLVSNEDVDFSNAFFCDTVDFRESNFSGNVLYSNATFNEHVNLAKANFSDITFRGAKFRHPRDQEESCRLAKTVLEKIGNREEAGYHFYREMEAIRRQNGFFFSNNRNQGNSSLIMKI